jgi:ABC-type sugar transport system permease subunit
VVLILFAALQGIPGEQAEAARVDGAGTAGLIWHIVLPRLRPAIVTVLFLRFADAVKVFDYAFALTGGGPGTSTETASLYTFRRAIGEFNLGYGSALAYIMFVVAVVVGTALLTLLQRTNKAAV